MWGDSHYAGHLITWMPVNLGWTMQPVRALRMPKRGILGTRGRGSRLGQALSERLSPASQEMGGGAQLWLDGALATALARS